MLAICREPFHWRLQSEPLQAWRGCISLQAAGWACRTCRLTPAELPKHGAPKSNCGPKLALRATAAGGSLCPAERAAQAAGEQGRGQNSTANDHGRTQHGCRKASKAQGARGLRRFCVQWRKAVTWFFCYMGP